MQKQATPAMIAIAVIVLVVVLFVIYKFTIGKSHGPVAGGKIEPGPPADLQSGGALPVPPDAGGGPPGPGG